MQLFIGNRTPCAWTLLEFAISFCSGGDKRNALLHYCCIPVVLEHERVARLFETSSVLGNIQDDRVFDSAIAYCLQSRSQSWASGIGSAKRGMINIRDRTIARAREALGTDALQEGFPAGLLK